MPIHCSGIGHHTRIMYWMMGVMRITLSLKKKIVNPIGTFCSSLQTAVRIKRISEERKERER